MTEVAALDARMTRLEDQVNARFDQIGAGFDRIENLLRQEISDLKTEQINDLRDANRRLADDQRRLWDRLNAVELRESNRVTRDRTLVSIGHALSAAAGGLITWLATWLTGAPPHH